MPGYVPSQLAGDAAKQLSENLSREVGKQPQNGRYNYRLAAYT
jgi:hypothetical protein